MFMANVRIDNQGECVNAISVSIDYPTSKLRAVDFSRGQSIMNLWVDEPAIDTEKGTVLFSGGIPGGYCGRIQGDPALSNVVGTIVFSVISGEGGAAVSISPQSEVYLSDGQGTKASLTTQGASFSLLPYPVLPENPWLKAVNEDMSPPDSFDVIVESTKGIFGGRYYLVFSTVDKQSGLDHFELFERGAWRKVESPHLMRDQRLEDDVQLKAIDKAGNERMGNFARETVPPRQAPSYDLLAAIVLLVMLGAAGVVKIYADRRKRAQELPPQA
jgi:hypothetical protein